MAELSQNPEVQQPEEEVFDLAGFLLECLEKWKWFALSVFVCAVLAFLFIKTRVPVYQVNSSVYLSSEETQFQNLFSDSQNPMLSLYKPQLDETELEILKSRNNIRKVVDSLNLAYSYSTVGLMRNIPLYNNEPITAKLDSVSLANLESAIVIEISQGSDSTLYDIEASTFIEDVEEELSFEDVALPFTLETSQGTVELTRVAHIPEFENPERIVITNLRRTTESFVKDLNLAFAEKASSIVKIDYSTALPAQGVDLINTMIEFYNRQIIEEKNLSAVQTEAFILQRLVMINDELRNVEQRLQEYRQAHNISSLEMQMQSNIMTQQNVATDIAELDAKQSMVDEIESIIKQADVYSPVPSVTGDTSLDKALEGYNNKVSQLNRMLETSTQANPLVKNMQTDLAREKTRILQSVAAYKNGLNAQRTNVGKIERRSESQLSSLPPIDKGLQEIFREQQVKVNIYTYLLEKREEIALQKTLATPTARLIDNPIVSEFPIAPRKMMILFIALIFGLFIPAGIIYLRRMLHPVFNDKDELQKLTKVPVIGEISRSLKTDDVEGIVVAENVTTVIAELFRLLRNNIAYTKESVNKKVILLTSSVSGEGKTFVAANLAMTYALAGKRTLVIGMDIRRPFLARRFGFTNKQGLTTYLSGQENNIDSLILQSNEHRNLFVMPAGPVPPNPNELLMSDRMNDMMAYLRSQFDYIILDTAPIGLVSDTLIIIPHSDIQLYVQRAGVSTKNGLQVMHQAIRAGQLPNVYLVLNGVNMGSTSYSYRKYGYYRTKNSHYGYNYVTDEDGNKTKVKK